MGCDIHFFVEHKNGSKWKKVDPPIGLDFQGKDEWYFGSDYDLFCMLGNDVRVNDLPLIGNVIKELPKDLSGVMEWNLYPDCGEYHSHNWLSLSELLNFDWDATFRDGSIPDEWVGDFKGERFTYADRFNHFIKDVIEPMKALNQNFDNVRCIYAFDN